MNAGDLTHRLYRQMDDPQGELPWSREGPDSLQLSLAAISAGRQVKDWLAAAIEEMTVLTFSQWIVLQTAADLQRKRKQARSDAPIIMDHIEEALPVPVRVTPRLQEMVELSQEGYHLVVRKPNPQNRRQKMVIVTTDGMDYVTKTKRRLKERMRRHLRHMGTSEQSQLLDLLEELIARE